MFQVIHERHRDREAMSHSSFWNSEELFEHATAVAVQRSQQAQYRPPSPPPQYSVVIASDSSLPSYKDCVAV